jgi:protein O-GlcNAc transferase
MVDEALRCHNRAIELEPKNWAFQSNRLYLLYFHPAYGPREILREHEAWGERFTAAAGGTPRAPQQVERRSSRRLRVGYVSAHFCGHSVASFFSPLVAHHDRSRVEVICYSSVRREDAMTKRICAASEHWRDVRNSSDEELARVIREDKVDVLVDLALHMEGSRLGVFVRKPAPVQVTWLGYAGTSGLKAMDYRLTDPHIDPPGEGDDNYSERSVRLPHSYWCYEPMVDAPEVQQAPALRAGHVTFGSFNHFAKVSEATIDAWISILRRTHGSRLMLHCNSRIRAEEVRAKFSLQGVDGSRVLFAGHRPLAEYLRAYNEVDIALDPFPYAGGTTTCDALWMGVPVVTLAADRSVGRGGVSLLTNVGMRDGIAQSVGAYVELAVSLAGDLSRLTEIRRGLRQRMRESPLMDGRRFAADMERAIEWMWEKRCEGGGG